MAISSLNIVFFSLFFSLLYDVTRTGKKRPAVGHLGKYAPDAPQVHGRGVRATAHQYVWRTVPQGYHLMGVTVSVCVCVCVCRVVGPYVYV